VVIWDEAVIPNDRQGTFNSLVTEGMISINPKHRPPDDHPNRLKFIISSNSLTAIRAKLSSRRIFAPEIDISKMQNHAYFKKINDYYDYEGGKQAFLHYLMHEVDVSDFNPMKVPQTKMLGELKEHSLDPVEEVFLQIAATGVTPEHDTVKQKCLNGISAEKVSMAVIHYCETNKIRVPERLQPTIMTRLRSVAAKDKEGKPLKRRVRSGQSEDGVELAPWLYLMPDLDVYRKNFKGFEARWEGQNKVWSDKRLKFEEVPPSKMELISRFNQEWAKAADKYAQAWSGVGDQD
jgi:hypothetical protein